MKKRLVLKVYGRTDPKREARRQASPPRPVRKPHLLLPTSVKPLTTQ